MATSNNLMAAHHQWANRPADERYWNLQHLFTTLQTRNDASRELALTMGELTAKATPDNDIVLVGKAGVPAQLSHWSFNQLSAKVGAPADYLRKLPCELAAANINHGLRAKADEKAQLLIYRNGSTVTRAITTDYSRIWNGQIVHGLMKASNYGWVTPPARPSVDDARARPATAADILPNQENFGLAVKVGDMIAPAGVYEGDRDMFVFLVNPERLVDDGVKGLMRGMFIWNSEVGAGAFKVQTFLLENVCGNHIVWGASSVNKFRIVHRGNAIRQFGYRMSNALKAANVIDLRPEEQMIKAARVKVLGKDKDEVVENLYGRKVIAMTRKDLEGAWEMATKWEHTAKAAPNTAWGFVHGLTRYSQNTQYADERNGLDRAAGRILELAV